MASTDEVLAKAKSELDTFISGGYLHLGHSYNTGYGGRFNTSTETIATVDDLRSVAKLFQTYVQENLGALYSVRVAKSFSGGEANEWSLLVEKAGEARAVLNFHMGVAAT